MQIMHLRNPDNPIDYLLQIKLGKKDSNTLESGQRRTRLTRELYRLPYYKRLERRGLTDLSSRRERGETSSRYHHFQLSREFTRVNEPRVPKFFFTQ